MLRQVGLAYPSGWMTGDLFAETLGHFIKFMKVSKSNPGLLLVDNHISHLSIEAIDMAKENGLCLLTFPPHCSHKLQPLDIGVYGPFKRYYSSFCDSWMTSNPEKSLSMYEVAELSGHAFQTFSPMMHFYRLLLQIFPFSLMRLIHPLLHRQVSLHSQTLLSVRH